MLKALKSKWRFLLVYVASIGLNGFYARGLMMFVFYACNGRFLGFISLDSVSA